jgi:hypothetical protein
MVPPIARRRSRPGRAAVCPQSAAHVSCRMAPRRVIGFREHHRCAIIARHVRELNTLSQLSWCSDPVVAVCRHRQHQVQIPRIEPIHDAADCQPSQSAPQTGGHRAQERADAYPSIWPQRTLSGGSGYGFSISRNFAAVHAGFRGFRAAVLEAPCARSIIFKLQSAHIRSASHPEGVIR